MLGGGGAFIAFERQLCIEFPFDNESHGVYRWIVGCASFPACKNSVFLHGVNRAEVLDAQCTV